MFLNLRADWLDLWLPHKNIPHKILQLGSRPVRRLEIITKHVCREHYTFEWQAHTTPHDWPIETPQLATMRTHETDPTTEASNLNGHRHAGLVLQPGKACNHSPSKRTRGGGIRSTESAQPHSCHRFVTLEHLQKTVCCCWESAPNMRKYPRMPVSSHRQTVGSSGVKHLSHSR